MSAAVIVLVWTCVVTFILTVVVTFSGLFGFINIGGTDKARHDYFLKRLFHLLIGEVVIISVSVYGSYFQLNANYVMGGYQHLQSQLNNITNQFELSQSTAPRFGPTNEVTKESLPPSNTEKREKSSTPVKPVKKIQKALYVTSDEPRTRAVTVNIPDGWQYLKHKTIKTTQNGDTHHKVVKSPKGANKSKIKEVKLSAKAEPRALFGARNWLGMKLLVWMQKQ